jgi:hypothetical protein
MIDYGGYTQPGRNTLMLHGYGTYDDFRTRYDEVGNATWDPTQGDYTPYNWNNTTHWGIQHDTAWEDLKNTGTLSLSGSYMNPNKKEGVMGGRPTFMKDGSPVYKYDPTNFADKGGWEWVNNEWKFHEDTSTQKKYVNVDQDVVGNVHNGEEEEEGGAKWYEKVGKFAGRYGPDLLSAGLQFIGPYKANKLEGHYMGYNHQPGMKLKRVDYTNLLNRNQTGMAAARRTIENSVTGPGKVAALNNLYAAKVEADAKVQSGEVTKNTEIGNTEAQINAKIASSNFERMANVDKYNADMKQTIDEIKVNAADKAAARGASVIQNALSRISSKGLATQMQADSGIVSRTDFMKTHEEWNEDEYMKYIKKWYPEYYKQLTA